jgi:predicted O-methyltransferase YrrM
MSSRTNKPDQKPDSDFTSDWVTPHKDVWDKLFKGMSKRPISMIEIGAWEGRSLKWWLENVLTDNNSKVVSIDPHYQPERWRRFLKNVSELKDCHKVWPIRGESRRILSRLPEQAYDLVYVDGSHEGRDVLSDAIDSFQRVKVDGIVLFDDYKWPGDPNYPLDTLPGPAIDAFLKIYRHRVDVIHNGYQLAIRRKS